MSQGGCWKKRVQNRLRNQLILDIPGIEACLYLIKSNQ